MGDYEIGYGRPPEHSRFPKGQSGNPRGRPKKVKNLRTELIEELGELIPVREGERTYKVSKRRAVIKSLCARSIKGDSRALGILITLLVKAFEIEESSNTDEFSLNAEERELLASVQARLAGKSQTTKSPSSEPEEK